MIKQLRINSFQSIEFDDIKYMTVRLEELSIEMVFFFFTNLQFERFILKTKHSFSRSVNVPYSSISICDWDIWKISCHVPSCIFSKAGGVNICTTPGPAHNR